MAHRVEPQGALRRELSVWEAIGLSLALMAPSMAANINPQATAGTVGRAVPLAFLLATLGVLLIAYTFVRLCQRFHHAGSVRPRVSPSRPARIRPPSARCGLLLASQVFSSAFGLASSRPRNGDAIRSAASRLSKPQETVEAAQALGCNRA